MALSEVQLAHDVGWNCPILEGGILHQNGYRISGELRRSVEFSAGNRRSIKEEEDYVCALDDVEKVKVDMRTASKDLGEEVSDAAQIIDRHNGVRTDAENSNLEDHGLRNRVWALEEEKGALHKDLAAMTLKETILRDKVREFELQMDGHRKRVEKAERTILELRQAAAQSSKQSREADIEVEELRSICARNDGEKLDMQNRVERLQQLCMDHEKSIHGLRQGLKNGMDGNKEGKMSRLQKELQRLNDVEITLRNELEASRVENVNVRRDINYLLERFTNQQREGTLNMKKLEQDLRAEIDCDQAKFAELQDENNLLYAKLRLLTRERHDTREALRSSNDRVSGLEEENQCLLEKIAKVEWELEVKQKDILSLQSQMERSIQDRDSAQAAFALKEKVSPRGAATMKLNDKEENESSNGDVKMKVKDKELPNSAHLGSEMRQSLQAAAQQLYSMNERLEALMNKLSERDFQLEEARAVIAGKDDVVNDLEHSLSNLAKTVDSQNSRIMRLSKQNEVLTRESQSQCKQIEDFQTQITTALGSKTKADQELDVTRTQLEEYEKQLESQSLTCQLLQGRVDALEVKLQHCQPQITSLLQQRDALELERENLHHSLANVTLRVTEFEHRLDDREEVVKVQETTLQKLMKEMDHGCKELILVKQERDEMQKDAEAMSREALRTSMEVEVLRRRIHQLDEDVLLRDGQICILRGGLEDS
ncbi:uncharacterized protein [Physcomitrium patens]|uniref:Uncharacterized protein n=1 Tax=Physcomitrium patens TaxID=3218 RepID=A0A2K1INL3_PHYPA|nr:cytoskeletal protein Sojo-like [Physcomitrium patens]XP_024361388.1 cytoskeletal protein Sojo-like [Physcomitrium patens]XP_024361389.1 cytoskeletal protein Sojo-like [Physcomitrium patens]XP_024361390.1 cytoskeletal protein Sojo-like [Physcomitrium patens]XP_024361392.1 cytoskeletal protein Sojo-like [Physcomitrium patens]XP_024361393.1 cytoskeletal protein Sojo-like [Physcomitrium patens]PNR30848.1 hypothetical protein PHYPA_027164 [Physcomitrium patens]|eukprot:XP_024361387.1 cytoskeletal protein Sojo-like [Physcomitrella patens]